MLVPGAWLVLALATGVILHDGAHILSLSEACTPMHDANYFAK